MSVLSDVGPGCCVLCAALAVDPIDAGPTFGVACRACFCAWDVQQEALECAGPAMPARDVEADELYRPAQRVERRANLQYRGGMRLTIPMRHAPSPNLQYR